MTFRIASADIIHFPALRATELAAFELLREFGAVAGTPQASSDAELLEYRERGFLVLELQACAIVIPEPKRSKGVGDPADQCERARALC